MSALNENLAQVKVQSDGRRYKRFVQEGGISITFRENTITGNLVNLSATGLLAYFDSNSTLPVMSENVAVHIEVDGEDNILNVAGTVVRLQPPNDSEATDIIELAIDFVNLNPSARNGIQKLIKYLLVKSKSYEV
jgi:c-di-GMP-binding flagellar brake protein YcgR